jgi:hypothetical protein
MVHTITLSRRLKTLIVVLAAIGVCASGAPAQADNTYGSGTYGSCTYNSCGISLTSGGNVSVNVTPAAGVTCTLSSDTVSVLTDSSTGYTLQITDTDTTNDLTGAVHGGTIAAAAGTAASPLALTANTWGYRVDGMNGFGAGPTSAESNGAIPAATFAGLPLISGQPDTIASTTTAADPAITTTVWYGVCANTNLVTDTYIGSVTYTALVN